MLHGATTRRARADGGGAVLSGGRSAALVGGAAFVLYAATACPTVWFGDSGELIAAAHCLGVAHPPGYPLWTALAKLFLLLPVGEAAFRVNLFSAASAAAACGLATLLVSRATGSALGAIASGTFLMVSATFWSVATVAEVYALHVLLGLALLLASQALGRGGGAKALAAGAVALGLGLAHHPTIVLWLPAAAWLACRDATTGRWRAPAKLQSLLAAGAGAIALASVFYLWMMLRARGGPPSNWGNPSSLEALWAHASAQGYRYLDLGFRGVFRLDGWSRLLGVAFRDLAWAGLAAGLFGMARPGPKASARAAAAALAILAAASFLFGIRYSVDDPEVFVLSGLAALALAGGLGIANLARGGRSARAAAVAILVVVPVASVASHGAARNRHGLTAALDYARDVLGGVPRGGTLFVESDDAFPVVYAIQVLGERSDLTVYHRRGLLFRDLTKEAPPPPGAPANWSEDRLRVEQAFLGAGLTRNPEGEFWFLGWPGYDPPPVFRFEPVGLLWRLARSDRPLLDVGSAWDGAHESDVRGAATRDGGSVARAFAATYPLARGERALFENDRARAETEFEQAQRVAGEGSEIPNYVGAVWARSGDLHRAVAAFRKAVESNPASIKGWENLARALEMLGDREGAREARERSRDLVPVE